MNLQTVIVDDSDIVIFLHKEILSLSKFSAAPLSAINGKVALDLISQPPSEDDSEYLILLDINMPVMDGWQFLDALQKVELKNQIHVIIVTSSIDTIDKKKASQYPQVIGFNEKPLTTENCRQMKALPQIKHFFEQDLN